jgi:hypothetical protein
MQNQSNTTPKSEISSTASPQSDSSPLTEADERSLDELINRCPEPMTDGEIRRIVEALRAQHAKFALSESTPKPKKAAKGPKPVVTLDDIL